MKRPSKSIAHFGVAPHSLHTTNRCFAALVFVLVAIVSSLESFAAHPADTRPLDEAAYRRPVDLLVNETHDAIAVACSGTGEIDILHRRTGDRIQKITIASSVDALVPIQNDLLFAAISTHGHSVTILRWGERGEVHVLSTHLTNDSPVAGAWDSRTSRLFVSCLWSKRLSVLEFAPASLAKGASPELTKNHTVDLSFSPRSILVIPEQPLFIVADGFGRELCVLDTETMSVKVQHDFFGSSIRSLVHWSSGDSLSPGYRSRVLALHSMVNEYAKTDENEIHWGVLITNDVHVVDTQRLVQDNQEGIYRTGKVHPVGIPGNGAAEPTCMSLHQPTGAVAVAIGGTDQIAIGKVDSFTYRYVDVGRYPSSVVWSKSGAEIYVANQFDDSISVVDTLSGKVTRVIEQGPIRELTTAELGEQLFHSATLSHDRWLTCASCHTDGHTNGQIADNFADRSFGAPKRVLSLRGVKGTGPFTWLGHEMTLANQTISSIRKTMNSYRRLDDDEVASIVAYMESLEPSVPLRIARKQWDPEEFSKGKLVFESRGCSQCHKPDNYTTNDVFDVGFRDERGVGHFNPPSLRGVSQKGKELFHDNRANGLRGVLVDHQHQLDSPLSDDELKALLVFLESI